jgi:hypothetical protein
MVHSDEPSKAKVGALRRNDCSCGFNISAAQPVGM